MPMTDQSFITQLKSLSLRLKCPNAFPVLMNKNVQMTSDLILQLQNDVNNSISSDRTGAVLSICEASVEEKGPDSVFSLKSNV